PGPASTAWSSTPPRTSPAARGARRTDGGIRKPSGPVRGRARRARGHRQAAREGRAAARGLARRLRAWHRAGAHPLAATGRRRAAGGGVAQVRGREGARPPGARRRDRVVNLERYLAERARLVDRALAAALPADRSRLRQAMRYSLLGGGKRIRPIL